MKQTKPGPKVIMCACGEHARIEDSKGRFFAEVCSKQDAFLYLEGNALQGTDALSFEESGIVRELVKLSSLPDQDNTVSLSFRLKVALLTTRVLIEDKDITAEDTALLLHPRSSHGSNKQSEQPAVEFAATAKARPRKKHRFR